MSFPKDLKKIFEKAKEQGWRIEQTKGGHYKLFAPDKKTIVLVSGTPKSGDTYKVETELKKAGVKL